MMGDDADNNSEDEALLEILGLSSLGCMAPENDADENSSTMIQHNVLVEESRADQSPPRHLSPLGVPRLATSQIQSIVDDLDLLTMYQKDRVVIFPAELSVPARTMRRLADELIWGSTPSVPMCGGSGTCRRGTECDRTYETIRVVKRKKSGGGELVSAGIDLEKRNDANDTAECNYEVEERRVLTRLENFVAHHEGWSDLCLDYLTKLISALCGEKMVLYKEKLNIKPAGGSGFAPHLDSPSLRVALGEDGPQDFVTVMVAIDDMTVRNGCLRVVRGAHTEENHVEVVLPKEDGNPDGDGRAGAIPDEIASGLDFEDIVVKGGTIAAFGGWVPHRSAVNTSPFPRRAVFLTYNPAREGSCRQKYYNRMKALRDGWRAQIGLAGRKDMSEDERLEMDALASVPK